MKNKKLLIGVSLITMLTTGTVGAVIPSQNASAHDITTNQVSTTDTQTTIIQTNKVGETANTVTQTNTQEVKNSQAISSSKRAAIYQAALSQVGTTQDCTMLVTNALKAVGISYHDWPVGYMSLGTVVSASAHIAVYAGNGKAVHGGWLGNQTVVNSANVGSGTVYIRVS